MSSIPAGTIHSSGAGSVVLEISATPNRFTFKLWDWGRVDLDGKPRPTHIDLGKKVLNFEYDTKYVKEHFINQSEIVYEDENNRIEKTGLPKEQLLNTYRIHVNGELQMQTHKNVSMLNLVEGSECIIEAGDYRLKVHYAETFIVPASITEYKIISDQPVILMLAQVR